MTDPITPTPSNASHNSSGVEVFDVNPTHLRAFYGTVGVMSILCNGALILVILRQPRMLRHSYNVLVLSLAITDTITGIFVTASPSFVIGNELMPIPTGAGGEIFCQLIQYNFFVWMFVKFSIAIVLIMAIERWYIIARPHKYKVVFRKGRLLIYVALLFAFSFGMTAPQLLDTRLEMKSSRATCQYNSLGGNKKASMAYSFIYIITTVFLPFIIIGVSYFHLRCVVFGRQLPPQTEAHARRRRMEMGLLRMTAAVAVCLAICFIPNHFTYILVQFGLATWDHMKVANALSMLNSVINPFIYCLTNKVYRNEFAKLLCPCCKHEAYEDGSTQAEPETVFSLEENINTA